jgi:curved DNA-binding protein CbpA
MIDYFALLGIERRPFISDESLKKAYLQKTESSRSDAGNVEALSSFNTAFRTLSNPATRTQHLLTLEFGDARGGQLGSDLGGLFGTVAEALQAVDNEFGSLSAQSSALLRAMAFQRIDAACGKLDDADAELSNLEQSLLADLQRIDKAWIENRAQCRASLAQVALNLTFVQKWSSEVHERKIRLEELA